MKRESETNKSWQTDTEGERQTKKENRKIPESRGTHWQNHIKRDKHRNIDDIEWNRKNERQNEINYIYIIFQTIILP